MSLSLKIVVADKGTRRFTVSRDTSFEQFQLQVLDLFAIDQINWKYIDEENDEVTFSTSGEWQDIIQNWPQEKLLKLFGTAPQPVIEQPTQPQPIQRGSCCSAFPSRIFILLSLVYSAFFHPFLTIIGLMTVAVTTYSHYPATFNKLKIHGRKHWRKLAIAFGLRALLSCSCCTLLLAIPIGFIIYRKVKKCSASGCDIGRSIALYLFNLKHRVQQFAFAHNIRGTEDACKFACHVMQGKKCPARVAQPEAPIQEPVQTKEPSAPGFNEIYPQVNDQVPAEPFVLPQRTESGQFTSELDALQMMGFSNTKLNEHLLKNFNGDLDRVINSLLQLSAMK